MNQSPSLIEQGISQQVSFFFFCVSHSNQILCFIMFCFNSVLSVAMRIFSKITFFFWVFDFGNNANLCGRDWIFVFEEEEQVED
jgi:hypothetical protein